MKTIKIFSIISLVAVLFSGCASSWLDDEPSSGMLTEEQFNGLNGTIEGQILGLYSLLDPGSSDHHSFGQKSQDIVTDLIASDMAMSAVQYGWFVSDAQLLSINTGDGRNSEFWFNYYYLIKNCNMVLKRIVDRPEELATDANLQSNYAQALSMRAYAYMSLYNLYLPSYKMVEAADATIDINTLEAFPVYVETSRPDSAQGPASVGVVRELILSDLNTAIAYFTKSNFVRSDKLYFDRTLAEAHLAKFYLEINENDSAYKYAEKVIIESPASLLPKSEVLTDGFNDYSTDSWIWGSNTISTNRGMLRSFFAHVDFYTYGYAPGAPKVIDSNFYGEDVVKGHPGDIRAQWFRKAVLNPYKKFFSAKSDRTLVNQLDTAQDLQLIAEINQKIREGYDRDWFSDLVYMRIEEVYLIASEAAMRAGDLATSADYLAELNRERYENSDSIETVIKGMAGDASVLSNEIKYNWRIELWGEGESLQTMKRFNYITKRGPNHRVNSGEDIDPAIYGTFAIPYAETATNPNYATN